MMTDIGEAAAVEVQPQIETSKRQNVADVSKAGKELTTGILAVYQAPLEQIQNELGELTNKQETLISQMQVEIKKLGETQEDIDLNELKRALRLQHMKQKEALTREQREKELIGKPLTT
ncbi:uncharacterized protein LOC107268297 isoform X2 [Cephus cinctus]|uniref:Uncharacterized protein LOC107268297 isoform X2 n=1 Tax=Cephus cinctus TaxID=211228 RepID=A0AAJ7FKK6_CEPCN|nr:uncharacterized protein LOC107268297 isoform X2 [Cephus cinctus]